MPRTVDAVEAYARDPANRQHLNRLTGKRESWNGLCEAFVNNAGDFDQSFNSALLAGDASGPLDSDWTTARRGEIHYWAGVGGNGHVAFELGGGLLLMASASVTDLWGDAYGTVPFRTYALKGIPYRGHTRRHGTQTLGSASLAGTLGAIVRPPAPPTPAQEADMRIFRVSMEGGLNGTLWGLGPEILVNYANESDAAAAALRWNPDKAIIDVSESEFDMELFLLKIPANLKQDALVGGSWSRGQDLLTEIQRRPTADDFMAAVSDAITRTLGTVKADAGLPNLRIELTGTATTAPAQ